MSTKDFALTLLSAMCIFLVGCIYSRTPFMDSSIATERISLKTVKGDSIVSTRYYRDMAGNWIFLDKGLVVGKKDVALIYLPAQ